MPSKKYPFLNFQVDHMTMLVEPDFYNVAYVIFRIIFGCTKEDVIYEKRKEWKVGAGEESMTFAIRIGQGLVGNEQMQNTIIALVQPSEPGEIKSHVRDMLHEHNAAVHWQHIALRTSDLLAFHKYALDRGVNFITPILKDEDEDVIQCFTGEWFLPNSKSSGVFFEFVQRNPTPELLKKIEEHNRECWFRDKTFLGLYGEKENEYRSGKITPFLDHDFTKKLQEKLKDKKVWQITENDIGEAEKMMLNYVASRPKLKARAVP